jgi:hypothetical protein
MASINTRREPSHDRAEQAAALIGALRYGPIHHAMDSPDFGELLEAVC